MSAAWTSTSGSCAATTVSVTWGGNYRMAVYDRSATRAFIRAVRAAAPGHMKVIYFNDPVLIREGLTPLVRRP